MTTRKIQSPLAYLFVQQGLAFILLAFFLKGGAPVANVGGALFLTGILVGWSAVMALPPCLPSLLVLNGHMTARRGSRVLIYGLCALVAFATHLFLIADRVVLGLFGYHINGLVLNLFLTPGGIESMGLQGSNYALMALGGTLLFALEALLAWWTLSGRLARRFAIFRHAGRFALAWLLVACLCLGLVFLCEGIADYKGNAVTLAHVETCPLFPYVRMRRFLRRLGVEEPTRDSLVDASLRGGKGKLRYPATPVIREAHGRPNIVWLVAESLRADMLTPEIMPHAWELASSRGVRFTRHYSGGHGTRPAMFSMFYGLHANCWDTFLRSARAPLLFDWLREDNYAFLCQTSAKFSYPEFDRTIFASMKDSDLKEYPKGIPWQRDGENIDNAIAFVRAHGEAESPFFLFCFFEGTHASYSFPEDEAADLIRTDYIRDVNYALVSEKDADRLMNRYVNAAHRVDFQIGRLLAALDERPAVAANTIVVVTGDHGEEFYEKGRLGHNSTFVEEQIRTPLVLVLPDVAPAVYEGLSHHTDILPTLAPRLGVANPPADYCVGGNLLDPAYARTDFLCFGWDVAVFATGDRKYLLPIGKKAVFGNRLTTLDDHPVKEDDGFLKENAARLHRAQQEMFRFIGR